VLAATLATGDTDEWDDTDRDVTSQATAVRNAQMFEDTGVVIVNRPAANEEAAITEEVEVPVVQHSEKLVVTFRAPKTRAATHDDWPPAPRQPAVQAPATRDRAFRRAAVYKIVGRPETKNENKN
jgi:hypothetical protein